MGQEAVCRQTARPSRRCSHTHGRGEVDGLAVDYQDAGTGGCSSPVVHGGGRVDGAAMPQAQVQTRPTCRSEEVAP